MTPHYVIVKRLHIFLLKNVLSCNGAMVSVFIEYCPVCYVAGSAVKEIF